MKKFLFILTLSLLCTGMSWAQNVIFVKSGVTDGDIITEGGVSGAAYTTVKAAMAASAIGDTIRLLNDITEAATENSGYGKCCVINDRRCIDGNGHSLTVTGSNSTWDCAIFHKGGTFKNLTLKGAFRGIFCGSTALLADLVIDNCVLDYLCYTISVDGGTMTNHSLIVTNSTINGWTSYSNIFQSATYTNCTFGKGSGSYDYSYFRPYGPTEIHESSFSSDYSVDPRQNQILFNDCDIAGTPLTTLTTNNLNDLLVVDQEDPSSHAVVVDGDYSANDDGEITGGIYGGNLDVLNSMCADGYRGVPIPNTNPQQYLVTPIYYIHFNAGSGTGTMESVYVPREAPKNVYTVPACTFTNGEWSFAEWNTQADGQGARVKPGDELTLTDDVTLYAQWAKVFNTNSGIGYDNLQAAIDAATAGDSLVVLTDLNVNAVISVAKNLIINGGKHNINTTATRGLWTDAAGVNLTLRNFNLNGGTATNRGIQVNDPNVTIVMDSCRIIMQDANYAILAIEKDLSNNPNVNLHMTVTNSYIKGLTALRSFAPEANFTFVNDTLHGVNPYNDCPSSGNYFAVIMLCGDAAYGDGHGSENTNISFENCVIIAEEQGNCSEEWIGFVDGTTNASGIVDANTKILDGNENDITEEVNMSDGGPNNRITMPLTATQVEEFVNDPYITVTDNGNGTYTISTNVYYDWTTGGVYCDFHSPFKEGWLADDETINLLENVTMTENLTPGIVKFKLKFNGKTITKGDYCIMLEDGDTVITDAQTDIFCADGGRVVETDNGDGTYTYSMAQVYNATQNKGYNNLQPAIDAAAAGDSIVVMTDLSSSVFININKSIIINGGKHTLTSTATRGFRITQSNLNVTIRNLNEVCPLNPVDGDYRGISFDLDLSNVNLLVDSCRITGSDYAINLTPGNTGHAVTVKNSYIQGWAALNSFAQNTAFTFVNDTLHGINKGNCSSSTSMYYATICLDGGSILGVTGTSNTTLDIQNSVVIAQENTDCVQRWIDVKYGASICEVSVDGNTKIIDGDENDVTSKIYVYGAKNTVTLPLTAEEKAVLAAKYYTLTDNPDGSTRVSHSIRYTQVSATDPIYVDFHYPFTTHNLAAGDLIELLEDVTMTQEVYAPFDGNFTLHFKDVSEEHSITQGDYTIVLDDDQTCTTDKQALALFSSINVSSITETDNNNGTWTYSVTPYNIITYYSNNSADEEDAQTKPNGETVNLYDYKTFDHADSTIYRWNTQADGNGTDYALGAAYSANADLDLYAVWLLNLNMTMDSTDVVCYGKNNGTDTVKIIGGEAPFQIVLSSTVMAENDTVKNLMDRTHIFTNLKPGKYNVQLTDVLKKDTIKGTFTIAQPDTLEITALTVPEDFPCPLMGNGSYDVSVTAQGGNGGYHYTWSEAAVNNDAAATTVFSGADDRDSIYTVKVVVTDSKNCTAEGIKTFTVSKVIADDGTVHSNSKLTIDTIRVGIMSGCDTVYKEYGTPVFTTTIPGGYPEDRLTIVNNIATAYPDSVFYLGENKIIWTATDTCGHSITGEQVLIVYHFPCPNVTDVDGNDYPSVRLGCDCWMAENLKTTKYSDGRAISNLMKYESPTHPDAEANFAIYGYLYDWTAALDAEGGVTPDADGNVQGVCPTGWHMPTDLDFANVAGVQGRHDISDLRSTDYWLDGGGNNSTNFNLLPGGFYNDNTARYENILGEAYLWSVNSADPSQPKVFWADCHCYMWQVGDPSANMGASVRCVKD